jgi:hypothetical protein
MAFEVGSINNGLQDLCLNRNVASLITYLKNVKEVSSRDIEMATGLRQPEVSMLCELCERGDGSFNKKLREQVRLGPQKSMLCSLTLMTTPLCSHFFYTHEVLRICGILALLRRRSSVLGSYKIFVQIQPDLSASLFGYLLKLQLNY